jgi:anti-sigma B factor antagonist
MSQPAPIGEPSFNASIRVAGDHQVARIAGELDADTQDDLMAVLDDLLARGIDIAVDLGGVSFLDSTAVRALLAAHATAAERGVLLTVVEPSPIVERVLDVAGVRSWLVCG